MAFCTDCGEKLNDGAKFCHGCGVSVGGSRSTDKNTQRKQEYSGKIVKCPMCGESLNSFEPICPACHYELRGSKATDSAKEFSDKINELESKRTPDSKFSGIIRLFGIEKKEPIDEQILSLIRNFSVPNTKEDVFEFMILASSNINSTALSTDNYGDAGANTPEELNVMKAQSEAWLAKVEQVYYKAKLSFGEDADFIKIQELYDKTVNSVRKAKKTKKFSNLKTGIVLAVMLAFCVSFFAGVAIHHSLKEKKLESIVVEIQQDIKIGNYDEALIKANTLHMDDGWSDESKAAWDKQREYLINLIEKEKENNN